jgi:NitT/TauT family transport system ATP-binding protein
MIALRGVSKRFATRDRNGLLALDDVSLTIEDGTFVALIGPSGCGKSTLLRLVNGLLPLSGGRIEIGGVPVQGPRDDMAMVFQSPVLMPWATVLQNVTFPLRLKRQCGPADVRRARDLLAKVGLAGFEQSRPHELSGGMQQRVAICRALVQQPRVLLMDEPFGALDALTREELSLELLSIFAGSGMTVLFVTHSIPEAVLLADRVVTLSARPGRISDVMPVPLPRPRDFAQEALPEFQACTRHLRALIFRRAAA